MSQNSGPSSSKREMSHPDASHLDSSLEHDPWSAETSREEEEEEDEDVFGEDVPDGGALRVDRGECPESSRRQTNKGRESPTGGRRSPSPLSFLPGVSEEVEGGTASWALGGLWSGIGSQGSTRQIVTLQSLTAGWTNHLRDSGYVPSPSSAHSFTFSSSEDEEETKKVSNVEGKGVTPPIAIPRTRRRGSPSSRGAAPPPASPPGGKKGKAEVKVEPGVVAGAKTWVVPDQLQKEEQDQEQEQEHWTPVQRGRTRSCPEYLGEGRVHPRVLLTPLSAVSHTPLVTQKEKHVHQRNWSSPATTPEGAPIFTPPSQQLLPPTPTLRTTRSSRDTLIDLTEEDQGSGGSSASNGHRRRVLVLALPDLIADLGPAASTMPEAQEEGEDQQFHMEERSLLRHNMSSSRGQGPIRTWRVGRPAWQRPRALSCDVTLEVEVGQELRRIADNFDLSSVTPGDTADRSVWGYLRNSFRRKFSSKRISAVDDSAAPDTNSTNPGNDQTSS